MSYKLISIALFIIFFLCMLLFTYVGHWLLKWHVRHFPSEKHQGNKIVDGAVFALMGLLIAFTFSGAIERFDIRRGLVTDEANAIEAVYMRFDLLPDATRSNLTHSLQKYLDLRISMYKKLPDVNAALPQLAQAGELQHIIWQVSSQTCKQEKIPSACIVLLPAITKMIDVANLRDELTEIHPPIVIIITLISTALLSAILCGYSMRRRPIWHSIHTFIYAFTISFTIFIVLNLEYPRVDFIHADYFINILSKTAQKIAK